MLLAIVYWIALAALEQQLVESVERETQLLEELYQTRGVDGVVRAIQRRLAELGPPSRYYLLQDTAGRRIAGNLPPMKPVDGKIVLTVPAADPDHPRLDVPSEHYPVVALGRRFSGGDFLLVGENRYRAMRAEEAIMRALGWGIVITVLLAVGGGAVLAAGFLRR